MPEYGGYAVQREIYQSGRTTVFVGSRPGDKRSYAIKVFNPIEDSGRRRADAVQAFLAAVEIQKTVRAKDRSRWAPVAAAGECAEGAFLVTPFYPRSVEKVIEGRVAVDLPILHWIVASVIRALDSLDRFGNRAHGSLKPSNIFIGGSGRLRKAPLILSEPAPLVEGPGNRERAADFQALGALIAWFIRRREQDGWPIEDGPEWNALGSHGAEWREFCNFLLNPTPNPDELTIAELRRHFARLGGKGASTTMKAGAVLIPLIVLSSPFIYLRFAPFNSIPERFQDFAEKIGNVPPDVEQVPPEFGQLCTDWYTWFGGLLEELNDPDRNARWQNDPYLKQSVLAKIQHPDELDPRKLAKENRNFESLRANPPESAKRGTVVRHVLRAKQTLNEVAAALKAWPGRTTLNDDATKIDALGWTNASEPLKRPGAPALESGNLTNDIDATMRLTASASTVLQRWNEIDQRRQTLAATGDPVLSGLADLSRRQVADASLSELPNRLADQITQLDARVNFVSGDWSKQIGHDRWLRESSLHDFKGLVTPEIVARWDAEIRDYYFIAPDEDPRRAVTWKTPENQVAESLRAMTNEEQSLPAPSAGTQLASARFSAEATDLQRRIQELSTDQVLRKDRDTTTAKIADLKRAYSDLSARLLAALDELRPNPAAWLTRIRNLSLGFLPTLNREWDTRRERLLAGATAETLVANEANFRALRGRVRQLQDYLAGLDGPDLTGRVPMANVTGLDDGIAASVKQADDAQRDQIVGSWLPLISWKDDLPQGQAPALAQNDTVKADLAKLQAWREEAGRYAQDLQRVSGLLDQGRGLSDGIEQELSAWANRPVASQVAASGRAAELVGQLQLLNSIPLETDRAKLITGTKNGSLSVGLASWRRLGALADWPANLDELKQEAELVASLREKIFKNISDTGRRVSLAGEVAAGGKERWRKVLAQTTDEATIGGVFAQMDRIGVSVADLSETEHFDYLLSQAKAKVWARSTEADTKSSRDRFVQEVRALPTIAAKPEVDRWLNQLSALDLVPKGISTLPADIGPGRAGWEGDFDNDGHLAHYRWRSPQGVNFSYDFVLVEPPDGVPFYLATQAISVGDFISLVESRTEGRDVVAQMPTWIKDVVSGVDSDSRPGPQTWRVAPRRPLGKRVTDSGIILNPRWTAFVDSRWPAQLYPSEALTPPLPTAKDPMQNLPPRAAQAFLDRLLGARLVTPEEWSGVVKLYGDLAKPDTPGANFSDRSWLAERDYLVAQGGQFEFPWPDSGVFRPGLDSAFKTHAVAEAYAPNVDDGHLWFVEVDQGGGAPFHHLFGNVATYLFDPDKKQFFVAGGSALSPKDIDPRVAYPVDAYAEGFADVGVRAAFDASPVLIIRSQLIRLMRNQLYLRP